MILLGLVFAATFLLASGEVEELSDENFKSRINEIETGLVMFYAPWCGHCKQLKPEFERAREVLSKNDPPVELLKIDCTVGGKDTCGRFGVSGYPTLKIFKNGVFLREYDGPRDRRGIVKHMKRQVSPPVVEITSKETFDEFISQDNVVIVGFFNETSALKDVYNMAADKLSEKFTFGITNMTELGNTGIVLFRPKQFASKFEQSQIVYEGLESTSDLEAWLNKNLHGLVDHRTIGNKDEFKPPLVVSYFNVDYELNPKGTNYWRNRIMKVAKDFSNDFNFAISSGDDFHRELEGFGVEYDSMDKPLVTAVSKNNKKYIMEEDFSAENFTAFLTALKADELEPVIKSDPIPKDNDKPVKVAVARNFDEVVLDNGQDTLIEFYAPWCGHCNKLAPVWYDLGVKMADEDVTIVKMDATSNDVPPPFKVEGFPTIYWAPKDKKDKPVVYEGGRKLVDLLRFIAKESTSELKNYDRKGKAKKKDEL